ncbi:MAG: hypothetical protein JO287_24790 [Pseudonocardiales bacterium]|nr:hypothetical protein [Pseudonocardiales bacterium]
MHRAQVIGRLEPTTGIEPFNRLVARVMTTQPDASAQRVFWVVDNGSSRGQRSVDRMRQAWLTAQLVHLPMHASWLDQIEIYYSILQRKVLTPNDLTDLDASPNGSWPSKPVTTPPQPRSTGDSPAPTSTGYSTRSPPTRPPIPRHHLRHEPNTNELPTWTTKSYTIAGRAPSNMETYDPPPERPTARTHCTAPWTSRKLRCIAGNARIRLIVSSSNLSGGVGVWTACLLI